MFILVSLYIYFLPRIGLLTSASGTSELIGVHQELYVFSPIQDLLDGSRRSLGENLNLLSTGEQNAVAHSKENAQLENLYKSRMRFGTGNSTTVTSQVGASAHLPCTVHNIGEGVVSEYCYNFVIQRFLLTFDLVQPGFVDTTKGLSFADGGVEYL